MGQGWMQRAENEYWCGVAMAQEQPKKLSRVDLTDRK